MNTIETFTTSNETSSSVPQTINMLGKELDGFDYDGVRKSYFEELERIEKSKLAPSTLLWNRELLYNKILETKISTTVCMKYEVITVQGEDWLIQRRTNTNDYIVRFIPSEFCFDIITTAHIVTGHGNSIITESAIPSKYIYPKFCIPIILKYCNVCRSSSVSATEDKIESCWNISIVEMEKTEQTFKYLMICIEKYSEYTLLRPLMSKSVYEVSMELLKIFSQFGVPNTVMTTKNLVKFMNAVAAKVLAYCPWSKFQVSRTQIELSVLKYNINNILRELNNWIAETGCNKWEIGCHIVQWKVNTTRKNISCFRINNSFAIDIPYNCFFGSNVNVFNQDRKELLEQERNTKLNQNKSEVDVDGASSINKLMYTEESTIVDLKKMYTTCCVCNNNMIIQHKCWFCHKPIHSNCGTIMRMNKNHLYTVRCKFCILCKGMRANAYNNL